MVGLGLQEILILGFLVGLGLVIAVVVGVANRGGRRSRELERENEQLRDENERLRGKS